MKITVQVDGQSIEVKVGDLYQRPVIAMVDGERFEVWPEGEEPFKVRQPATTSAGASVNFGESQNGSVRNTVIAPIPGHIVSLQVKPGDVVSVGDSICVLEAMKMKNTVRSPRTGRIQSVNVHPDQHVGSGEVLVRFENE